MSEWVWAAARARGTSHIKSGTSCQDAFQIRALGDVLLAIAADGAGSAQYGGAGAFVGSRTVMEHALLHFEDGATLPTDEQLWSWIDAARDRIGTLAASRDSDPRAFASTMICVLAAPSDTIILHIGDGVAALQFADEEGWNVPLWPAHGEYASTTFFLTDDPQPQVRIERRSQGCKGLVCMTDGLERLALDFASTRPHAPFFDGIMRPLDKAKSVGEDKDLSRQLRSYLASEPINARTDDDKTLLVALRR